ncbi:MAG: CoA activase [Nitrospinae bacterium]|nr:CoA activase [Nitrospinota bacterium]
MNTNSKLLLGLDIGSVSLNTVVLTEDGAVLHEFYTRLFGKPVQRTIEVLESLRELVDLAKIECVGITGAGGQLIAELLGKEFVNEVIAQSRAVVELYPGAGTVIEMGGEDSKLLLFQRHPETKAPFLADFSMNTLCAAGTGSFLDQQAARMRINIENDFGELALKSQNPPRIAGRCSVFAKSDMIHLQGIGTPDYDIVAGLCYAVARSFKSNLGRGKEFQKPVLFQGGVAANKGVVAAFENILGLNPGELIIPKHHASMGAIGAALTARDREMPDTQDVLSPEPLRKYLESRTIESSGLDPLPLIEYRQNDRIQTLDIGRAGMEKMDVFLGIDIGSLSTNVVLIDSNKDVVARRYLRTAGRPITAVCQGLREIGEEVGDRVKVRGVGTTGSGRYMIGDLVGSDTVRNEITAQATAAVHFHPEVDTIFEIGGQDSKYISIKNGVVVDFEMNKVCAAGTGSFIEEQAEKLGIHIEEEFGELALSSENPSRLGDRCTVFMETNLVSHQQKGHLTSDLTAGLSYSIVKNYLNRVVCDRPIGKHILFQGGVAWNKAVVSAFEKTTERKIHIPPHHDVTGAIGSAMLAQKWAGKNPDAQSRFKGFDLSNRPYTVKSFACKQCANVCNVSRIQFEKEKPNFYGARCEIYEVDKKKADNHLPDLFEERNRILFQDLADFPSNGPAGPGKTIGIPRVLHFYEFYPLWQAFFKKLGFRVILSEPTSKELINKAAEGSTTETCFPIKIVQGHVERLLEQGVDYIFLPSFITGSHNKKLKKGQICPYVQAVPYLIDAAIEFEGRGGVKLLKPAFHFADPEKKILKEIQKFALQIGVSKKDAAEAFSLGREKQDAFYQEMQKRGREVISRLKPVERAMVIISRPYNGCDPGLNMDLPQKFREMGAIAIPMDFLPLEHVDISDDWRDMYWRYGQRILSAARLVKENKNLSAVFLTNFGCGPDSFIQTFLKKEMGAEPFLQLEMDEHNADAGMVTRCEAFLDSLENCRASLHAHEYMARKEEKRDAHGKAERTIYIPYMSDATHAIAAAFQACGTRAEVLPVSTWESVELAKKFTSGKECYPTILTLGDFIKKAMAEDFDSGKSAFFMPSTDGPCRFGLYYQLHDHILKDLGKEGVVFVSPNQGNSKGFYGELKIFSSDFFRKAWQGIVAFELLEKLMLQTRPYETNKGETDRLYKIYLKKLFSAIVENRIIETLEDVLREFSKIQVTGFGTRPVVGIVGEIYIRSNWFGNANVVREIEDLGGEVWMSCCQEWIMYVNHELKVDSFRKKDYKGLVDAFIKGMVQNWDMKKMSGLFEGKIRNLYEPKTRHLIELSAPYLHKTFTTEALLSVGKSVDFSKNGVSGIVNLMPFTCMPGNITASLLKKVREDNGNFPCVSLIFDGTEDTNTRTRLEAFMHQVREFQGARAFV